MQLNRDELAAVAAAGSRVAVARARKLAGCKRGQ